MMILLCRQVFLGQQEQHNIVVPLPQHYAAAVNTLFPANGPWMLNTFVRDVFMEFLIELLKSMIGTFCCLSMLHLVMLSNHVCYGKKVIQLGVVVPMARLFWIEQSIQLGFRLKKIKDRIIL